MVLLAQFFLAGMFVYEEKILKEYEIKVFEIVGWEGVWGVMISFMFIIAFYFIPGNDFGCLENPFQALNQIGNNYKILISISATCLVMWPYNYYGTNLTKHASAMHRCIIDSLRMIIIWVIAQICSWENFSAIQALGYSFVLLGNLFFNNIIAKKEEYEKIDLDENAKINETNESSENNDEIRSNISNQGKKTLKFNNTLETIVEHSNHIDSDIILDKEN